MFVTVYLGHMYSKVGHAYSYFRICFNNLAHKVIRTLDEHAQRHGIKFMKKLCSEY